MTIQPEADNAGYLNAFHVFTDANGQAKDCWVLGWASRSDREGRSAYLYDHLGSIAGKPGTNYDILDEELGIEYPPEWQADAIESGFVDINSSGRLVGYVFDPDGNSVGFYCDLFATDELGNPLPRKLVQLPLPDSASTSYIGRSVNENGDILVVSRSVDVGYSLIFNPDTEESIEVPVMSGANQRLNDARQTVGFDNLGVLFRFTPETSTESATIEYFPECVSSGDIGINNAGQFTATIAATTPGKGKNGNGGSTTVRYAARFSADGDIDWLSNDGDSYASSINQTGDLVYGPSIYRVGQVYYDSLRAETFVGEELQEQPDPVYQSSVGFIRAISDRDRTGLPWMLGAADIDGDGSYETSFILRPLEPSPGFDVSPLAGLTTTEDGGQATFTVVLQTQPSADVVIGINSSDLTEGDVDPTLLTFTPANYATPQTVTVTGVDDPDKDGDVEYQILLSTAVSGDLDYDGMDPDDVTVTNRDNDSKGGKGGGRSN